MVFGSHAKTRAMYSTPPCPSLAASTAAYRRRSFSDSHPKNRLIFPAISATYTSMPYSLLQNLLRSKDTTAPAIREVILDHILRRRSVSLTLGYPTGHNTHRRATRAGKAHIMEQDPVWLKYCVASRCLAMIVAEQSTEALPPHHVPRVATHCPLPRDQLVVETLVIALRMIVLQVLLERIRQGACTQYDHLLQGLLLDGTYEPFAIRVQVWAPRG